MVRRGLLDTPKSLFVSPATTPEISDHSTSRALFIPLHIPTGMEPHSAHSALTICSKRYAWPTTLVCTRKRSRSRCFPILGNAMIITSHSLDRHPQRIPQSAKKTEKRLRGSNRAWFRALAGSRVIRPSLPWPRYCRLRQE